MLPASTTHKPRAAHSLYAVRERRETGRIQTPAPVRIRGAGEGHGADVTSVIDNIGAGGFYVRLLRTYERGARLSALIRFGTAAGEARGAARLAVRGRVLRVDELPGGVYGVAVKICNYRFV